VHRSKFLWFKLVFRTLDERWAEVVHAKRAAWMLRTDFAHDYTDESPSTVGYPLHDVLQVPGSHII
jgi:hypothetical protein